MSHGWNWVDGVAGGFAEGWGRSGLGWSAVMAEGHSKQIVIEGLVEETSKESHWTFAYLAWGLERGEAWRHPQAVVRTEEFPAHQVGGWGVGSSREGCRVREEGLGPNPIRCLSN